MIALPAYIDAEAWAGFVEMRRAMPKSKPFTVRAAKLVLYELHRIKEAGHCPNAALDQSTLHGWADVYVPQGKELKPAPRTQSADEYVAEKATAAALDRARVSKPPAAIKDLLSRVKP